MKWRSSFVAGKLTTFLLMVFAALPLNAAVPSVLTEHPASSFVPLPMDLSKSMQAFPLEILPRAEFAVPARIEALNRWNAEDRQPSQVGFVRPLEMPRHVSLAPDPANDAAGVVEKTPDAVVWASRVEVERAYRLRLRLSEVKLPANAELWVQGNQGDAIRFGLELLRQEGDLWTPSVSGDVIHLQVRIPSSTHSPARAGFRVDSVAQIFRLDADGAAILDPTVTPKGTECLQDAACFSDSFAESYKEAVAHLQFIAGSGVGMCTGAMMNDSDDSGFIPYMLTANHCFSTQSSASTLEAFFDYIALSCGGSWPSLGSVPWVGGATLLATTPNTDSTFVRLSRQPGGTTVYLGWETAAVDAGVELFRLSHPMGWVQVYSTTETYNPTATCQGLPASRFIYSFPTSGATTGGSSGAPTVDGDLRVRGQLLGKCGPDTDPCSPQNSQVDGRFSTFASAIEDFLDPAPPTDCQPSDTVLCLRAGRFKIESGREGSSEYLPGIVVSDSEGSAVMRYSAPNKWELMVNVQPRAGRYWFSATGLTEGREYDIEVTDVTTGQIWTFILPEANPRVTNARLSFIE